MEGVSECVAFDLNVMKIVLKISEENFILRKEQMSNLRVGIRLVGCRARKRLEWSECLMDAVTFTVKSKSKEGAELGRNITSSVCFKCELLLRYLNQDFQYGVAYIRLWLRV